MLWRFRLVAALIAVTVWASFGRNIISIQVNVPGPQTTRVHVQVKGIYRQARQHETRELIRAYVPANRRVSFRIKGAMPWEFAGLSIEIAHPGFQTKVQTHEVNPHWWRAAFQDSPPILSKSPQSDSVSVSDVERHYEMINRLFVQPLGLHAGAVQAWPHLEALRALYSTASFRLEGQDGLAEELKRERLQSIALRWHALEGRLQSVQFEPCTQSGILFMQEEPGVSPGCGLKSVRSLLRD